MSKKTVVEENSKTNLTDQRKRKIECVNSDTRNSRIKRTGNETLQELKQKTDDFRKSYDEFMQNMQKLAALGGDES